MTSSEEDALRWLKARNGDGCFCVGGKGKGLLAAGHVAPFTRATWNSLAAQGLVEFYGGNTGRARCRITAAGKAAA